MKGKLAKYISIVGHPMLTIPLFVVTVLFMYNSFGRALFLSLLIVLGVVLPIVIRVTIKTKNGSYTNFDVSDRKQRNSLFVFTLPLLIILTVVVFVTQQPYTIKYSILFATILIVIAQVVNLFIKSSLHVSLTLYLAFLALNMNSWLAGFFFLFSIAIGWSRYELKRHTLSEIIVGAVLGLLVGSTLYFFLITI